MQGDSNEINNMITDIYSKNNKTAQKSNIKSTSIFDPDRNVERKKVTFGNVETSNGPASGDSAKRKVQEDHPTSASSPAKQPKRSASSANKRGWADQELFFNS